MIVTLEVTSLFADFWEVLCTASNKVSNLTLSSSGENSIWSVIICDEYDEIYNGVIINRIINECEQFYYSKGKKIKKN